MWPIFSTSSTGYAGAAVVNTPVAVSVLGSGRKTAPTGTAAPVLAFTPSTVATSAAAVTSTGTLVLAEETAVVDTNSVKPCHWPRDSTDGGGPAGRASGVAILSTLPHSGADSVSGTAPYVATAGAGASAGMAAGFQYERTRRTASYLSPSAA